MVWVGCNGSCLQWHTASKGGSRKAASTSVAAENVKIAKSARSDHPVPSMAARPTTSTVSSKSGQSALFAVRHRDWQHCAVSGCAGDDG
jgi:hypothetical protein